MRPLILLLLIAGALAAEEPATLDLSVKAKPLLVALEQISDQCDATLTVDADCGDRLRQELTLVVDDAAWADVAALLRSEHQLALSLADGFLRVADAEKAWRAGLELRFYDIRPLLHRPPARPGPELDLPEPGGFGARLLAPIADGDVPGLSTFSDLIRHLVEPGSWERSGVTMSDYRGDLAVTHTAEAHAKIQSLLEELERVAARQIVTRVWRLDPAAAGEAVVSAERWRTLIGERQPLASFVTPEGHRNHHFSANQRVVASDVDVVQKVLDPIVTVISDGLVVDCQPTVVVDGVLATIRFSASRARAASGWTMSDDAGGALATLDTPDLDLDRSQDARLVPFGGGTVFAFGERVYGVSFEILQYHAGKPGEPRPTVP